MNRARTACTRTVGVTIDPARTPIQHGRDMPAKKWPPPGFPLVDGDYALTETWMLHLREQFARRIEDDGLVLWRPGVTVWLTAWGNDHGESQAQRLAAAKRDASPARFAERESTSGGVTRFSYRLRDQ